MNVTRAIAVGGSLVSAADVDLTTATLVTVTTGQEKEIIFTLKLDTVVGSPQLLVRSSPDNSTYTTEQTYTLSSSDNGKQVFVGVYMPTKAYYRLSCNLNSGTVSVNPMDALAIRAQDRKLPVVDSSNVYFGEPAL